MFNKREQEKKKYEQFGAFDFIEYGQPGENSFIDKLNSRFSNQEELKNYKVISKNRTRLMICFFVVIILMIILILRMGYWQIIKSDDLKTMAESMQKVDTEIEPVRGTIYDSRMSTLAETVTEYELYGYTQYLYKTESLSRADKREVISNLAEITGEDTDEIKEKLESSENLVLLGEGLSKKQVDKAKELWGSNVQVKTKVSRYYPNGAFAAQLLGGVNSENVGRTGLEYEYNTVLSGIKGRTVRTTDSQGNTVANGKSKTYQAQDGYSIVTTIDSVIQHYVEDALETGMENTGASSITCIVMNPKTGDILGIAQTPEYDPNDSTRPSDKSEYKEFKKLSTKEQSDYLSDMWTIDAVSDVYEPGSTFKLIVAAAALETGVTTDASRYSCKGYINVDGVRLGCLGTHGSQNIKVAVGHSCNAALGRVALDMGASKLYNYIDLFGFNDQTGIDLPGETNSIVKSPIGMSKVDLATTGYGQGIAITPIQMLTAVSSFGNGGVIMQPKLVKKIIDKDGKTIQTFEDEELRQVVSEDTAEEMCEIMEYYVSDAGGPSAYVEGYRVGGKTGTANVATAGEYSKTNKDCSFIAMAPMDDPVISMLVIVHHPTKTSSGDSSAGPIVRDIMEKALQYLGVEREYTESEKAKAEKNKAKVPNITGKTSDEAIEILKEKGFSYTIMPESNKKKTFKVVDQYPKAGTKVDKETVVYLYSE